MAGLPLYSLFLNWLSRSGNIEISSDFHTRCNDINKMLDNDVTGVINTVLDYSINSASETKYRIECPDDATEDILNEWLNKINININGVPSGIQELSKEYFRERWQGSSLCLMRVTGWEEIKSGTNTIIAPTQLWFVNGASLYIDRPNEANYVLGSDKYYLDKEKKLKLPKDEDENIFIQKPFDRWLTKYATPYTVRKGILKNFKAIEVLQQKGDEAITKVLPYLLMILRGDPELEKLGIDYKPEDFKEINDLFEQKMESYKNKGDKTPTMATNWDTKINHLIPDLKNILTEELFRQSYRALLSGLGFVTLVQGIGDTRKEETINPKPFIAELNAGVSGFKSMLLDVLRLVIDENKIDHKKLFSKDNELNITNTALKINIDFILDQIRTAFTYGTVSIQTYQETLGLDPVTEREKIKKEWENGDRDLFYARLIQNQEQNPNIGDKPGSIPQTKKQNEKQNEKTKNRAELEDKELAYYKNESELPESVKKLPEDLKKLWMKVFNETYKKSNDEAKAFKISWYVVNKQRKSKQNKASEEELNKNIDELLKLQKIEIAKKQEKLLDLFLKQKQEEKSDENIQK